MARESRGQTRQEARELRKHVEFDSCETQEHIGNERT